jgi:hypothetical protein
MFLCKRCFALCLLARPSLAKHPISGNFFSKYMTGSWTEVEASSHIKGISSHTYLFVQLPSVEGPTTSHFLGWHLQKIISIMTLNWEFPPLLVYGILPKKKKVTDIFLNSVLEILNCFGLHQSFIPNPFTILGFHTSSICNLLKLNMSKWFHIC